MPKRGHGADEAWHEVLQAADEALQEARCARVCSGCSCCRYVRGRPSPLQATVGGRACSARRHHCSARLFRWLEQARRLQAPLRAAPRVPESGFGLASAELAAAPRSPLRSAGRGGSSRAVRVLDADDAAPSAAAPAESAPGATAAWTAVAAPDARAASGSSRLVSAESLPGVASSVADWPPSTLSELAAAPCDDCILPRDSKACMRDLAAAASSACCCFFADLVSSIMLALEAISVAEAGLRLRFPTSFPRFMRPKADPKPPS